MPTGVLPHACMLRHTYTHLPAGQEVMYLTKRLGFVKLALQNGAHLLPAFAFGQSDTYS